MKIKSIAVLSGLMLLGFCTVPPLGAQTFSVLHNFTNTPDGAGPGGLLLNGGTLLGTTTSGGSFGGGSVFACGTSGAGLVMLHSFTNSPDGAQPNDLLLNSNTLYGTTQSGGTNSWGTVFKVSTNGTGYALLHIFTNTPDGFRPLGGLATDGNFLYGTASLGGSSGGGTIFRMDTNGAGFTVLHAFTDKPDGASPRASLILSGTNLYGTTYQGGLNGVGTVFRVATNGSAYSVIYNFSTNSTDANSPYGKLLLVSNVLYGTSSSGGSFGYGGTVFKLATNGIGFGILHSFTGPTVPASNSDGGSLKAGLIFNGGLLYGVASGGGGGNSGTAFQLNTGGTGFTVLKVFTNATDGSIPQSSLVFNAGTLLGTCYFGNSFNGGTLFSLLLSPVITAQPQSVTVTNGNPASFTVAATDGSAISYQWYFNTNTLLAGQTSNTLTIASAAAGNAGAYTVVVADNFGAVTSSPALLTVFTITAKPSITAQPQDLTVSNGVVVNFSVTANGLDPLKYFWWFNTNSANSNLVGAALAGKTNSTLTFTSVTNSGGYYYVIITNTLGKATSSPALLVVISKPIITLQPQSVTVTNGNPVTFTADATGAGLLNFQWYFRTNTLIIAATNTTLNFTNATTNVGGAYSLVVSNTYGKATSSYAFLILSNRPNLLAFLFNPTNGSFSFSYANTPKSTNRLWATTNLSSTNFWRAIATNVMATNGLWFVTDTNTAKTNNARFYRFSTP